MDKENINWIAEWLAIVMVGISVVVGIAVPNELNIHTIILNLISVCFLVASGIIWIKAKRQEFI
jgi:hypothetical protein